MMLTGTDIHHRHTMCYCLQQIVIIYHENAYNYVAICNGSVYHLADSSYMTALLIWTLTIVLCDNDTENPVLPQCSNFLLWREIL